MKVKIQSESAVGISVPTLAIVENSNEIKDFENYMKQLGGYSIKVEDLGYGRSGRKKGHIVVVYAGNKPKQATIDKLLKMKRFELDEED